MRNEPRYEFWIDRGGTFTDCIGYDRVTGELNVLKVLSSDRAPLVGIRRLLGLAADAPIPPASAPGDHARHERALERKGVRSALAITRGFADLVDRRSDAARTLFALEIERDPPCPSRSSSSTRAWRSTAPVVDSPDASRARRCAPSTRGDAASTSLGVVVMHDHARGDLERLIAEAANRAGFEFVSSRTSSREAGFLARAETTSLDAYLTPLLRRYLGALLKELPGSTLRLMQSSGGLTDADRFRAPNAYPLGPRGRSRRRGAHRRASGPRARDRLRHGRHLDRRLAATAAISSSATSA